MRNFTPKQLCDLFVDAHEHSDSDLVGLKVDFLTALFNNHHISCIIPKKLWTDALKKMMTKSDNLQDNLNAIKFLLEKGADIKQVAYIQKDHVQQIQAAINNQVSLDDIPLAAELLIDPDEII